MERPEFILSFRDVAHNEKLGHTDSVVFGYIYWMTRLKNERCFASNETLSSLTGLPVSTVRNSLTKLEKENFIKRIYSQNNPTEREEICPLMGFSSIMGAGQPAGGVLTNQQGGAGQPALSINKSIYINSENKFSHEFVITDKIPEKPRKVGADTAYRSVFDLWGKYPANWRMNKAQIQAAKNLLEEHGLDGAKSALTFAARFKDDPFCPEITSPYDLDSKWAKLLAFKKKRS